MYYAKRENLAYSADFIPNLDHGTAEVQLRVDLLTAARRAKVGAISFPIGAIEDARRAADEIAAELLS